MRIYSLVGRLGGDNFVIKMVTLHAPLSYVWTLYEQIRTDFKNMLS